MENGLLEVPKQTWDSLQPLTVFAVKGSNLLSLQEVCYSNCVILCLQYSYNHIKEELCQNVLNLK